MGPRARLIWSAVLIVGSAVYALLIALDRSLAADIMLGYIGIVLTLLVLINMWKKGPHGR